MNLNFGDVARVLGQAGSGILGGMRETDVENQKLAMQKALQGAEIQNFQSEGQFRTSEEGRLNALTTRLNEQNTRRRAMIPSMVGQINAMKNEIGEPSLDTTNMDQYDPDFLQQENLRLTSAVTSFRSRKDTREWQQQSHADIVRERRRSAIQDEIQRIEALNEKQFGMLLNPNSSFYRSAIHARYNSLQQQRHKMDMEDLGQPVANEPAGDDNPVGASTAKPGTVNPSVDAPGKSVMGDINDQMIGGFPDMSGSQASASKDTGTSVVPGSAGPASARSVAGSITDRQVDYANQLMQQGIPRAMAIQRAKNEVH